MLLHRGNALQGRFGWALEMGKMPKSNVADTRLNQVLCIAGMAMVWPSLHNQLLYPITFSFNKAASISPYAYYLVFFIVFVVTTLLLVLFGRKGVATGLFSSMPIMVGAGVIGSLGAFLLTQCTFMNYYDTVLMGIGVGCAAVFIPVHFVFWSQGIIHSSEKRAAYDLALSYLVFCIITFIRLALHIHGWLLAIIYPLLSAVFAAVQIRHLPQRVYAYGTASIRELPLYFVIPSVLLIYAGVISRCLLNPVSAAYVYPPSERILIYVCGIVLTAILAVLYRPHGEVRRNAQTIAFVIMAVALEAGILITGIGSLQDVNWGNFPTIAAINVFELYLWMMVLTNAQIKHDGVINAAALYLIFVVEAGHLINVLVVGGEDIASISVDHLMLVVITAVLALAVAVVVNLVMVVMLLRRNPAGRADSGRDVGVASGKDAKAAASESSTVLPYPSIEADEDAFRRMQETFHLSGREMDTLRLAVTGMSAKEIAEQLYIAESTVNSHIKSIHRKCDVHSRRDLIALVNRYKNHPGV